MTDHPDTIIIGAFVPAERVAEVTAILPPGEVLVAVRVPRSEWDATVTPAMVATLQAAGTLFTHASRRDAPADEFRCDVDTVS